MNSLPFQPSVGFKSVVHAVLAIAISILTVDAALADEMCGKQEQAYMERLVTGLQPYASQVTSHGKFAAMQEYGNGSEAVRISFSENGKQLFSYRSAETTGSQWAGIGARPGSTKSGQPRFVFYFNQGNTGACEANVLVKDGRFFSTPIRYVR